MTVVYVKNLWCLPSSSKVFKRLDKQGIMAHKINPRIWKVEAGESTWIAVSLRSPVST